MGRFFKWILRCIGCGRFIRQEDKVHGGKGESWHERCAMRAEQRRNFSEEDNNHGS